MTRCPDIFATHFSTAVLYGCSRASAHRNDAQPCYDALQGLSSSHVEPWRSHLSAGTQPTDRQAWPSLPTYATNMCKGWECTGWDKGHNKRYYPYHAPFWIFCGLASLGSERAALGTTKVLETPQENPKQATVGIQGCSTQAHSWFEVTN